MRHAISKFFGLMVLAVLFPEVYEARSQVITSVSIAALDGEAQEVGSKAGTFQVSLRTAARSDLSLGMVISGTATPGSDYALLLEDGTSFNGKLTFRVGIQSLLIRVVPTDDKQIEETEQVTLTIKSAAGILISTGTANVSIIDNDTIVGIDVSSQQIDESNGSSATVTFFRKGSLGQALNIGCSIGGTAVRTATALNTVGADYRLILDATPCGATIPAGQTSRTFNIVIIGDAQREGDETIELALSASSVYTLGLPSAIKVTIKEPLIPIVSITSDGNAAREDASAFAFNPAGSFTISRTGDPSNALVVHFAVNSTAAAGGTLLLMPAGSQPATLGSDFTLSTPPGSLPSESATGTLTIPPGSSSAKLVVLAINDDVPEPKETVIVQLVPKPGYDIGVSNRSIVIIEDDDQPLITLVTVAASDPLASETGPDPGSFTVTRTAPVSSALVVRFRMIQPSGAASPLRGIQGNDYVLTDSSGSSLLDTVVIPAGIPSALIIVRPLDDRFFEGNEIAELELIADIGGQYRLGSVARASITINDKDAKPSGITDGTSNTLLLSESPAPVVTITAPDASASRSGPDQGMFQITRTGPTATALNAKFSISGSAANGVDYLQISGSATIPPGLLSAQVIITPIGSSTSAIPLTVVLTLLPDPAYNLGTATSAKVTIAK